MQKNIYIPDLPTLIFFRPLQEMKQYFFLGLMVMDACNHFYVFTKMWPRFFVLVSVCCVYGSQGHNADLPVRSQGRLPKMLREDDPGGSVAAMPASAMRRLPNQNSQAQAIRRFFGREVVQFRPAKIQFRPAQNQFRPANATWQDE